MMVGTVNTMGFMRGGCVSALADRAGAIRTPQTLFVQLGIFKHWAWINTITPFSV